MSYKKVADDLLEDRQRVQQALAEEFAKDKNFVQIMICMGSWEKEILAIGTREDVVQSIENGMITVNAVSARKGGYDIGLESVGVSVSHIKNMPKEHFVMITYLSL